MYLYTPNCSSFYPVKYCADLAEFRSNTDEGKSLIGELMLTWKYWLDCLVGWQFC